MTIAVSAAPAYTGATDPSNSSCSDAPGLGGAPPRAEVLGAPDDAAFGSTDALSVASCTVVGEGCGPCAAGFGFEQAAEDDPTLEHPSG